MCTKTSKTVALRLSLLLYVLIYSENLAFCQPSDDFSSSAESWQTVGKCPAESSPGVVWSNSGGNPGGCIKGTDNSVGVWYFYAGDASWKNDLSDYYGCYLLFDLRTNNDGFPVGSQYDVLIIRGDDYTISYNTTFNPGTSWTSYIVPLEEGDWIVDGLLDATHCPDLSGTTATAADMISYLSDVKRIRIRAEFGGLNTETNFMDNALIDCSPLLPVELFSFKAMVAGEHLAHLTWSTATETNCDGFVIQKSTNGVAFDSIGFVPGNGTTTQQHMYDFFDDNFITTSYYRLKQLDYNEDFEYSYVISLQASGTTEMITRIFPNPASTWLNVETGDKSPVLQIRITDISGQIVYDEKVENYSGLLQKQIDLNQISSGIYIISLVRQFDTEVFKFQVMK